MAFTCSQMVYLKFIMSCVISLTATIFGLYLVASDRFKNIPVSTFGTNLITTNIAYWLDPPRLGKVRVPDDDDDVEKNGKEERN